MASMGWEKTGRTVRRTDLDLRYQQKKDTPQSEFGSEKNFLDLSSSSGYSRMK